MTPEQEAALPPQVRRILANMEQIGQETARLMAERARQAEQRATYQAGQQSTQAETTGRGLARQQVRQAETTVRPMAGHIATNATTEGQGLAQQAIDQGQARATRVANSLAAQAAREARARAAPHIARMRDQAEAARRREKEEARQALLWSTPEQRQWYANMIGALSYLKIEHDQREARYHELNH